MHEPTEFVFFAMRDEAAEPQGVLKRKDGDNFPVVWMGVVRHGRSRSKSKSKSRGRGRCRNEKSEQSKRQAHSLFKSDLSREVVSTKELHADPSNLHILLDMSNPLQWHVYYLGKPMTIQYTTQAYCNIELDLDTPPQRDRPTVVSC